MDLSEFEKQIIIMAAEEGARAAIQTMESARKKAKKERTDRRLHNTKLLLQNYRMLVVHSVHAVYNSSAIMEEFPETILEQMMDGTLISDEIYIESIKSSSLRTATIVKHIEDMLSMYEIFCEKSGNEEEERRYRILKMRYIDDPGMSVPEIAEKENVATRTVYKDLDRAIRMVSALIFGIDGVNFSNSAKSRHTSCK